jgi:death-on-curing protein
MPGLIRFLSVENILEIHQDTLEHEGGGTGIRDIKLLESAIAMPSSMFDGDYLHPGLGAMAAAYLFHLCQNHPVVDGNKRTAAFASLLFLYLNGVEEHRLPSGEDLEAVTLQVASGTMSKPEVIAWYSQAITAF